MICEESRNALGSLVAIYKRLLEEIKRRDYDVFSRRVRVSSWKKLRFALSVLPVRFGWR